MCADEMCVCECTYVRREIALLIVNIVEWGTMFDSHIYTRNKSYHLSPPSERTCFDHSVQWTTVVLATVRTTGKSGPV